MGDKRFAAALLAAPACSYAGRSAGPNGPDGAADELAHDRTNPCHPSHLRRYGVRPVGFFYGAFRPHLDQMQHAPINNSARHRLEKVGVRNAPEVVREVGVNDFRVATK